MSFMLIINNSEFISRYQLYIGEIKDVIKPELRNILVELSAINPENLIKENTFFTSENDARGFVWNLFLLKASGQPIGTYF